MSSSSSAISRAFLQCPSWCLSLASADAICNAAMAAVANLQKPKPVCVTVLDSRGGLLVQKRMDGCPDGAFVQFSFAKARTCIHLQSSSRDMRYKYCGADGSWAPPPQFTQAAAMASILPGDILPVAGGVLIQYHPKLPEVASPQDAAIPSPTTIIGAVGVSGSAGDEDEYLAIQGVLQGLKMPSTDGVITTVPPQHCSKLLKTP